ncbi:Glutathione S-transferase L1 [Colletotrichum chlorophyti]|uniref:Glutathione S-transferase L1 n=1 Tax=Colletotrichum chlorophyti TaxID=708187 RepID=A0A1Q8RZ97_9PEZI|nr:Glutathione S-transferase L1 [Colletotrichum chlorophyti]
MPASAWPLDPKLFSGGSRGPQQQQQHHHHHHQQTSLVPPQNAAGAATHFRPGAGAGSGAGHAAEPSDIDASDPVFHPDFFTRSQDAHVTTASGSEGVGEEQQQLPSQQQQQQPLHHNIQNETQNHGHIQIQQQPHAVPPGSIAALEPVNQSAHMQQHGHVRIVPASDPHCQFGILTPGPAISVASAARPDESFIGPGGFIPMDAANIPGWKPHGSLLSSKWVVDPPNLDDWRRKLFDADGLIILTNEQFEAYFPHVDNVYSHRSTQTYKKKPFISHYWDCRLKGRPAGTKKSDDPNKKRRNRVSRKLDLCDVKIKITEYFPGATLHDLDGSAFVPIDGTYVALNGVQTLERAHTVLAPPGEKTLRVLPATPHNLPAPGQKFWTIQRVNGHINNSGIPGPHQHTLAKSDEIKKNSIHRHLTKQNQEAVKNGAPKKATHRASWTIKRHEKESDLKLYSAYYCPFSQRVWIALEAKGLTYQYCEEDPYMTQASQPLLEANPRGTVPAIRQGDWACAESAVILEYINSRLVPAFYRLLRNPDPAQQTSCIDSLQVAIKDLVLAADEEGPFFLGNSLSLVDVHFAPFAIRLSRVLQPLRGWTAPAPGLRWARWLDALEGNPHVKATTSGKDVYTDTIEQLQIALDMDGHLGS